VSVAWVTGAASGIGAATARRLAAGGARVACIDVDGPGVAAVVAGIERAGGAARAVVADVTDADALAAAAGDVERRLGPVGVVAAAAGITHEPAEVAALDPATWQRVLAVNLTGVFLTAKAAIPQLRRRGSGAIVIVASVGGVRGTPGYAGYIASKHGVLGLMRSLAAELAPDGIRVNAVCPGSVDTPMLRAQADGLGEEAARRWWEGHLLQRLITADEVAAAVAWLAGDESRMTTGVALPVDGGYLERAP
jgi:NAD(P)-dependent dehydrogenase (short-subunit alcohol dehydrogenase family)